MDKINLPLQITEAEQHCRDMATVAAKGGKAQAMNRLRHRAALAILDTLLWVKDHEAAIRQYNQERKPK